MVEMKKDGTGKHDEIVNTLLDLQARLRAEGVPAAADDVVRIPEAAPVAPAITPTRPRSTVPSLVRPSQRRPHVQRARDLLHRHVELVGKGLAVDAVSPRQTGYRGPVGRTRDRRR